jgi:hypothetical protein
MSRGTEFIVYEGIGTRNIEDFRELTLATW